MTSNLLAQAITRQSCGFRVGKDQDLTFGNKYEMSNWYPNGHFE